MTVAFASRKALGLAAGGLLVLAMSGLAGCAAAPASALGTWGDPDAQGAPSLVLASDGSLSGSDGCNRLIGTWTATTTGVTFSPFGMTRMSCPSGTDTWLSGSATATVAGDTMTFLGADGAQLGTLPRGS